MTAYREPGFYDHIHAVAHRLYDGLSAIFRRHGVAGRVQGLGARFGIYFGTRSGDIYASVDEGKNWKKILEGLPAVVCVRAALVGK